LGGRAGFSLVVPSSQPAKHHQKRSSTIVSTLFWCVLHGFELRKATAAIPTAFPQQAFEPILYPFFPALDLLIYTLLLVIHGKKSYFSIYTLRAVQKTNSPLDTPAFRLRPPYRATYRSSLCDFISLSAPNRLINKPILVNHVNKIVFYFYNI